MVEIHDETIVTEKKSKGCFFWGCMTLLVIIALVFLFVFFMFRKAYFAAKGLTAPKEMKIERVVYEKQELDDVLKRVEDFEKNLTAEVETQLVLNERELNIIIDHILSANEEMFKGKFKVSLGDGTIRARASIPLSDLPVFRDRYFNGEIELRLAVENNLMEAYVEDLKVGNNKIPKDLLEHIKQKNILEKVYEDRENLEGMKKLKIRKLKIRDKELVLDH